MKLNLPKNVVARQRKQRVAFYFIVKRARPLGWPASIALPEDLQDMIRHAAMLNARLEGERLGAPTVIHPRGSLPMIVRDYQHSPEYKALAAHTRRSYEKMVKHILAWSAAAGHPHIRHLTRPVILKFLKKFEDRPTTRKKVGGMLRILCHRAIDMGEITANPALSLRLKENRQPPHIYDDGQVLALVGACKDLGYLDIAKAIVVAYSIGQREADILKMRCPEHYKDGSFIFRQSKTGEYLRIPAPQALRQWLAVEDGPLIGRALRDDWFRHLFARVRDKAGVVKSAKFMHFRHSAVVRLARAGNTVPEIAAVSGHSIQSTQAILDRYLPRDEIVAQNAIKKLDAYTKKNRSTSPQAVVFKDEHKA